MNNQSLHGPRNSMHYNIQVKRHQSHQQRTQAHHGRVSQSQFHHGTGKSYRIPSWVNEPQFHHDMAKSVAIPPWHGEVSHSS